jgi:hypothetical protein
MRVSGESFPNIPQAALLLLAFWLLELLVHTAFFGSMPWNGFCLPQNFEEPVLSRMMADAVCAFLAFGMRVHVLEDVLLRDEVTG